MNRICIEKSTGKLIEMQSGGYDDEKLRDARLDTLKQNALNAGYKEADIEVKWISDEELQPLMAALNQPTEQEVYISQQKSILRGIREQQIDALIEGDTDTLSALKVKAQKIKDKIKHIGG